MTDCARVFIAASLLLGIAACASRPRGGEPMVLETAGHTLTIWSRCAESEVGCADLVGELIDKATRRTGALRGGTYMVKCADGVTPCHLGFYDLRGPGLQVQAYPDGILDVSSKNRPLPTEHGEWTAP